jgi:hypothetical protein
MAYLAVVGIPGMCAGCREEAAEPHERRLCIPAQVCNVAIVVALSKPEHRSRLASLCGLLPELYRRLHITPVASHTVAMPCQTTNV